MEQIAIIRSEGGSFQKYLTLLNEQNFDPILVPSIDFLYKNQHELKECLMHPEKFAGIIFTSPRSVTAVSLVLDTRSLQEDWKAKRNFCVGMSTWNETNTKLGLNPIGKESGSATNLSDVIIKEFEGTSKQLPLLFPCSSIKNDTLPKKLSSNGISLKILDVYNTIPHPELEQNLSQIISNEKVVNLVFFSPSGVDACNEIIKKRQWNFDEKRLIAIGETTTKAIVANGLVCHGTAKTPSPEGLLEVLLDFDRNKKIKIS